MRFLQRNIACQYASLVQFASDTTQQPGSYGFHIGDAFLLVQNLLICTTNFQYVIKIEIIGAALQQARIISQIFGAALQQLHHR